jgi:hypothetical protein
MSDAETTVLYALSTLAQTCAALAAFVGAVGLYRLQILRGRRREAEFELRRWSEGAATSRDTWRSTLDEILAGLDNPLDPNHVNLPRARQARVEWAAFPPRIDKSRNALVVFEAWNLLVIGVSLVGFNYVQSVASSPCSFLGLWAAAVGTVAVTSYCVYAWTR